MDYNYCVYILLLEEYFEVSFEGWLKFVLLVFNELCIIRFMSRNFLNYVFVFKCYFVSFLILLYFLKLIIYNIFLFNKDFNFLFIWGDVFNLLVILL